MILKSVGLCPNEKPKNVKLLASAHAMQRNACNVILGPTQTGPTAACRGGGSEGSGDLHMRKLCIPEIMQNCFHSKMAQHCHGSYELCNLLFVLH